MSEGSVSRKHKCGCEVVDYGGDFDFEEENCQFAELEQSLERVRAELADARLNFAAYVQRDAAEYEVSLLEMSLLREQLSRVTRERDEAIETCAKVATQKAEDILDGKSGVPAYGSTAAYAIAYEIRSLKRPETKVETSQN